MAGYSTVIIDLLPLLQLAERLRERPGMVAFIIDPSPGQVSFKLASGYKVHAVLPRFCRAIHKRDVEAERV